MIYTLFLRNFIMLYRKHKTAVLGIETTRFPNYKVQKNPAYLQAGFSSIFFGSY
jgi:hypothetical protein